MKVVPKMREASLALEDQEVSGCAKSWQIIKDHKCNGYDWESRRMEYLIGKGAWLLTAVVVKLCGVDGERKRRKQTTSFFRLGVLAESTTIEVNHLAHVTVTILTTP